MSDDKQQITEDKKQIAEDKKPEEKKEETSEMPTAQELMAVLEELEKQGTGRPIHHLVEEFMEDVGVYPRPNIAVELCCESHRSITRQMLAEGKKIDLVAAAAKLAYGDKMPRLTGADNIRDFIACVTHGMILGIFPSAEGSRLLYAAQVAYSAIPLSKKYKKRRKTQQIQSLASGTNPSKTTT